MSGEVPGVSEVPSAAVLWSLRHAALLTVELAWHQQLPGVPPDGVLVHRKARSQDATGALVYDVRCRWGAGLRVHRPGACGAPCLARRSDLTPPRACCRPNSHQAQELLQAINATRRKYSTRTDQMDSGLWDRKLLPAVSHAGQVGHRASGREARMQWRCRVCAGFVVAVPSGLCPCVVRPCLRPQQLPDMALCVEYSLVWRCSPRAGSGPRSTVSIWRPVGPSG